MPSCRPLWRALALSFTAGRAFATVTEVGPTDDLRPAITALQPGDELVLRGGTYNLGYRGAGGSAPTAVLALLGLGLALRRCARRRHALG
jgi:MYXO-CTERM domain-containing protein